MSNPHKEIEFAIEVFVRGHSAGREDLPYEASHIGPLWVMRDAQRKNPRIIARKSGSPTASTPVKWMRSCAVIREGASLCVRWSNRENRTS